MGRKKGIPGLSFSWKRAIGLSSAKAKFSRDLGVPLTRSGRQRKIGKAMGCCVPAAFILVGAGGGVFGMVKVVEAAAETTMAQSGVQPDVGTIDSKAFAGRFGGTLPCADCPGIDETLRLDADGSFVLSDVYQERPDNKTDRDRMYAIDSNDKLTQLGADGEVASSGLGYSLDRNK